MDRKVRRDWREGEALICDHCRGVVRGRVEIVREVENNGLSRLLDGLIRVKHLVQLCEARMDAIDQKVLGAVYNFLFLRMNCEICSFSFVSFFCCWDDDVVSVGGVVGGGGGGGGVEAAAVYMMSVG